MLLLFNGGIRFAGQCCSTVDSVPLRIQRAEDSRTTVMVRNLLGVSARKEPFKAALGLRLGMECCDVLLHVYHPNNCEEFTH